MKINPDEISWIIKDQIEKYKNVLSSDEDGRIVSVGDGIALIYGLSGVMAGELVEFKDKIFGMVLNLEEDIVGVAVLGNDDLLKEGEVAKRTKRVVSFPVGNEMLGRVVDPLGRPLDGLGELEKMKLSPIDADAPSIVDREPVSEPMYTGIKVVDALMPIGRGQRQLIIGDRQTGKTAIAVDAMINQRSSDVACIYVAIGQKASTVAKVVDRLKSNGAMENCVVISASASDPAPLQYIAPYAGVALAEHFRDEGGHALVIYDDLSKHAVAYRQISLLLRRPPGREAYPGDIFYLHSRLLERAAKLSNLMGGGSLTALPIVETQAGDISSYIPTNLISITDGQIYLESDLFNSGVRPAVNISLSVSRVGAAAQKKAMKGLVGALRLDIAQYREVVSFSQFGAELDAATRRQIKRGKRLVEMLKQPQYKPQSLGEQIIEIYAAVKGYLDELEVDSIGDYLSKLKHFIVGRELVLVDEINKSGVLSDEIEKKLKESIEDFNKAWVKPSEK